MGLHSYRVVLITPGVPRLVVAAVLGRLSASMLGLSLLLAVVDHHGSYAVAGSLLTGHALALACCAPLLGRLADAASARRVLLTCLAAHAGAYAALVGVLAGGAHVVVAGAVAVAVGATTPPAGPVTRTRWPRLVAPAQLGTAYAFDSALNSATFVVGPVLAGALAAGTSPLFAMALAGVSKVLGDLLLATAVPRGAVRAAAGVVRRRGGPLADALVRRLLVVVGLDTFMHGALQVAAAAMAGGVAGLMLGVLAAGEVVGGLAYGARAWPGETRAQLVTLHLAGALVLVAAALTPTVAAVTGLYLVAGVASGGRDTLNQLVLGQGTAAVHRTEAFAWLGTFMWAGYGAGTAVAGQIAAGGAAGAIHIAAAGSALLAAVVVRRLPRAPHPAWVRPASGTPEG